MKKGNGEIWQLIFDTDSRLYSIKDWESNDLKYSGASVMFDCSGWQVLDGWRVLTLGLPKIFGGWNGGDSEDSLQLELLLETELGWFEVRAGVAAMSEAWRLFWLDLDAVTTDVGKLLGEHGGIDEGEQHENEEWFTERIGSTQTSWKRLQQVVHESEHWVRETGFLQTFNTSYTLSGISRVKYEDHGSVTHVVTLNFKKYGKCESKREDRRLVHHL